MGILFLPLHMRPHDDSAVLHVRYLGFLPNKHYILADIYDKQNKNISIKKKKKEFKKFVSTLTYIYFFCQVNVSLHQNLGTEPLFDLHVRVKSSRTSPPLLAITKALTSRDGKKIITTAARSY